MFYLYNGFYICNALLEMNPLISLYIYIYIYIYIQTQYIDDVYL